MEYKLPAYNEIPDLGLYLEQVTKYVNDVIGPINHTEITNSMISNYVKKGLISNPHKKQYDRDQIGYIIYIALAKQVLQLDDIQLQFEIMNEQYSPESAYNRLVEEFNSAIAYVFHEKEELDPVSDDYSSGELLLRNTVLAIAHTIYLNYCFEEMIKEKEYKVYQK